MVIAVLALAVLGAAFLVPNYMAIRYAMFGGGVGVAAAGGAAAAGAPVIAVKFRKRSRGGEGLFAWKALSPFVFAFSVILGIALSGIPGLVLVALATANLVWGMLGWSNYIPGKR
jgi:hypothetical protein